MNDEEFISAMARRAGTALLASHLLQNALAGLVSAAHVITIGAGRVVKAKYNDVCAEMGDHGWFFPRVAASSGTPACRSRAATGDRRSARKWPYHTVT